MGKQNGDTLNLEHAISTTHRTLCDQLQHIADTFCVPQESIDERMTNDLVRALDHAADLAQRYKVLLELRQKNPKRSKP